MIDKTELTHVVEQAIEGTDLFVVRVTVSRDNIINVDLDSMSSVDIDLMCNIILLPLKGAKLLNFSRDLFFLKMLILIFKILEFMKEKMKKLWKIIVNNLLISIFIKKVFL